MILHICIKGIQPGSAIYAINLLTLAMFTQMPFSLIEIYCAKYKNQLLHKSHNFMLWLSGDD